MLRRCFKLNIFSTSLLINSSWKSMINLQKYAYFQKPLPDDTIYVTACKVKVNCNNVISFVWGFYKVTTVRVLIKERTRYTSRMIFFFLYTQSITFLTEKHCKITVLHSADGRGDSCLTPSLVQYAHCVRVSRHSSAFIYQQFYHCVISPRLIYFRTQLYNVHSGLQALDMYND